MPRATSDSGQRAAVAEQRDREVLAMIEKERQARLAKTERLRALRLAHEAERRDEAKAEPKSKARGARRGA